MPTIATWLHDGGWPPTPCIAFGFPPKILRHRRAGAGFGSYLGGGVRQNKSGYLVRDDLPLQTSSVPTAVVRPPGWTSP